MTKISINSPGGGGGGSGTVTSVAVTTGTTGTNVNVSGSPITTSGTITVNIPEASGTNTGKLKAVDWTTFNNKQNAISLTTTGTSGAATFVGATLNIPQYQGTLTLTTTGTSGAATFVGATLNIPQYQGTLTLTTTGTSGAATLIGTTLNIPQYAATPAGSSGQVQFNNGGSFGADNDLFWDNSNKRLGIGTATPGTHLDVHSGADNIGTFNRTGSGNSYIQFALLGSNKWRLGYLNSSGDFIIYDVTNSVTRVAITNAGTINLQGNILRNFKAASSTLSSLTVDSSNGDSYTGTVFLCSGSSVTIDASVDDGFNLSVIQSTSTQTTISVTGGLTIRNRQGHTKTAGQYATVTLLKRGSDLYLGGDTA